MIIHKAPPTQETSAITDPSPTRTGKDLQDENLHEADDWPVHATRSR
jgi:hypothetical protein